MKKVSNICIVGCGMVGSQLMAWFKDALTYDTAPDKWSNTWEECCEAEYFFISVPTPHKEGSEYDLTFLEEAIEKIPDNKIVVIKSTVSPGTTDYFQDKYPNKTFIFNPEFLTELSAKRDFFVPDMQVLGARNYEEASKLMLMLPPAPTMRIVSFIDAEWIKKVRNAFYATKVIFFNEMFDMIEKTPAKYETIRSIVVKDRNIGNSHTLVHNERGRGAGGHCLQKDLKSLIGMCKIRGIKSDLLDKVDELNDKYLSQGL